MIGFITGVTGLAGPWGRTFLQAMNQIIDEFNAAGGIKSMGGAKIRLVVADSKTDLKLQASETEKMINVNKVKLFQGAAGSAIDMVGSAVVEKYGLICMSGGTADGLTDRGFKYYFRAIVKASENAKVAGCGW
jgi:branched-chain amino acid transport system substrate-binding protein